MNEDIHRLKQFIGLFTPDESEFDFTKIVKSGRNFYYADNELQELKNSIERDIYSLGIFIGEEKERFYPSPALIEMISKLPGSSDMKIFINKKAEWLFLCGRNILPESIAKNPNNISRGLVLVQNENDENLGYGEFKKEDKLIIKNILDKGRYLRLDEKGRKKR